MSYNSILIVNYITIEIKNDLIFINLIVKLNVISFFVRKIEKNVYRAKYH